MPEGSTSEELVGKIAVETGRNLLFLSPFIRPANISPNDWTFAAAWEAFIHLKEVSKIQRNLKKFVGDLKDDSYPSRFDALDFMTSAICKGSHLDEPEFYDARYFCVLDGIAHTIGQYVGRCAASVIEANRRLDLFRSSLWINTIRSHRSNPSVLGFLVEKAVLGYLSNIDVVMRLLDRNDLRHESVEVRTFKHGTEAATLSSAPVTLYIPEEFNYKAVDCVLRIIDRKHEKPSSQATRKSKRGTRGGGKKQDKKKKKNQKTSAAATAASSSSAATAVDPSSDPEVNDAEEKQSEEEEEQGDQNMTPADVISSSASAAAAAAPAAGAVSTIVTLLPIQVTIAASVSQSKRERSFRFFERRAAWLADFQEDPRAEIRLRFAFIVRRCAMQEAESAVAVDHDGIDQFQLSFFSLAAMDEQQQLDRAVDSPTPSAPKHNSPPRLQLAAATATTMAATAPAVAAAAAAATAAASALQPSAKVVFS